MPARRPRPARVWTGPVPRVVKNVSANEVGRRTAGQAGSDTDVVDAPARRTARLMAAGTTSDAGRSLVTTALCRAFARRGVRVAVSGPRA